MNQLQQIFQYQQRFYLNYEELKQSLPNSASRPRHMVFILTMRN